MQLPQKITPCPIIEAIVEIRFNSIFANEVLIGKFYDFASKLFAGIEVEKLPIMQLPEIVLSTDQSLKFQPYYRVKSVPFIFQFGSHMASLSNAGEYIGWDLFYTKLDEVVGQLFEFDLIKNIHRIGIRYINFFESSDIYQNITLEVNMDGVRLKSEQLLTRAVLDLEKFQGTMQIANNAKAVQDSQTKAGSVIDIDIYSEKIGSLSVEDFKRLISEGHSEEKKIFFTLLKPDFLATLNPVYKEIRNE